MEICDRELYPRRKQKEILQHVNEFMLKPKTVVFGSRQSGVGQLIIRTSVPK